MSNQKISGLHEMKERRTNTGLVDVIYVEKKDAKQAKTELERAGSLHSDFRLTQSATSQHLIALPIRNGAALLPTVPIHGRGRQECLYSTRTAARGNGGRLVRTMNHQDGFAQDPWSALQTALFQALARDGDKQQLLRKRIQQLSNETCPKKLELFGDDRTIVIPRKALQRTLDPLLDQLLDDYAADRSIIGPRLWRNLATILQSQRVVRRGEIDPDSGIRQSQFSILWQHEQDSASATKNAGWITVTENGIRQSFDLTRVMFSRGNVTEKRRFGNKLVQPNETVLDLYAGIGYFTLPALTHGKAQHVTCCEWNPDAVEALRYNLRDNKVNDRATVLIGDCRKQRFDRHYDRVSLGLLPSSEGGWSTAMQALSPKEGGWLHIHGNVPADEVYSWSMWMAWKLLQLTSTPNQSVVVHHVQKVKSFAPKVWHCVADVQVGGSHAEVAPGQAAVFREGCVVPIGNAVEPPSCALSTSGKLNQTWMMEGYCDTSERL